MLEPEDKTRSRFTQVQAAPSEGRCSDRRVILLRYNEVALKGGNRRFFEGALAHNALVLVRGALPPGESVEIQRVRGRLILHSRWDGAVEEALHRVFGLSSFSLAVEAETGIEALAARAIEAIEPLLEGRERPRTFRVSTRRTEKALPETSMEINRRIGAMIQARFPCLGVELETPELNVGVELRAHRSFLWINKIRGPGGLPVGTNGEFLTLLSGGLDSPVAAIQILKRGGSTSFIHFAGEPYTGPEGAYKAEELARVVNRYQPRSRPFYRVPFGRIQMKIALETSPRLRTVLYRRMMIRISEALALRIGASALVTGEAIGQVASQTIDNLSVIDQVAARIPILRPLITHDKDEIIELARAWNTYEISVRAAPDCCTLFSDRHPSLRTSLAAVEEEEARLPIGELVEEGLSGMEPSDPLSS